MKMIRATPAFPVRDIIAAANFYESKFDFSCVYLDDEFAKLLRDDVEVHLWVANDTRWQWGNVFLFLKPVESDTESFLAGTHSCRIQVERLDDLYAELKKCGVLYDNPNTVIETTSFGTREFPTLDLYGNLVTFFERIQP